MRLVSEQFAKTSLILLEMAHRRYIDSNGLNADWDNNGRCRTSRKEGKNVQRTTR